MDRILHNLIYNNSFLSNKKQNTSGFDLQLFVEKYHKYETVIFIII